MKKLLLAAALLIGVTGALSSCNNGAYDADPGTDLSNVGNPLDVPGGPYYMTCNINGVPYNGTGGYVGLTAPYLSATSQGAIRNDTNGYQLMIAVGDYTVPMMYSDTAGNNVGITLTPRSNPTNAWTSVRNDVVITITDVAATYIDGTFEGTITRTGANSKVTDGRFHVKKF